MPGLIPHILAGSIMFLIGIYYFRNYFYNVSKNKIKNLNGKNVKNSKSNEIFLLGIICLSFSLLPDSPLGLYYIFGISSIEILIPYHNLFNKIILPIMIIPIFIIVCISDLKRKPIWIIGIMCILIHLIMDVFIDETSLLF
jgi:hypothetical protein